MKLYLFVLVQRNGISIVKESATSIELPGTVADLFLVATSFHELPSVNIQVCFQAHGSLQWHDIPIKNCTRKRCGKDAEKIRKSAFNFRYGIFLSNAPKCAEYVRNMHVICT